MGAWRELGAYKGATAVHASSRRKKTIPENWDGNGRAPASLLFIRRVKHMPRFFFHVRSGGGDIGHDSEGEELPDLEAARREAVNTNREMLGERLLHGGAHHRHIEIANENGDVLAAVKASEVLFNNGQLR